MIETKDKKKIKFKWKNVLINWLSKLKHKSRLQLLPQQLHLMLIPH